MFLVTCAGLTGSQVVCTSRMEISRSEAGYVSVAAGVGSRTFSASSSTVQY